MVRSISGALLIHGELIGLELQRLAVVVAREAPHDVGGGRLLGDDFTTSVVAWATKTWM